MAASFNTWWRRVTGAAIAASCMLGATSVTVQADAVRQLGQAQGGSSNPACTLFTLAEVRKITGFDGYNPPTPGDSPGQGLGGGASCQWEAPLFAIDAKGKAIAAPKGPLLSLVVISGKNYTQTKAIGKDCRKDAVSGVGDTAFFEVCPMSKLKRTPALYVKVGSTDLVLQVDINPPDTDASLRPKLIALARAAATKVK